MTPNLTCPSTQQLLRSSNHGSRPDGRLYLITYVYPPVAKESTGVPVSSSLELPSNDAPSSSTTPLGQNKEWVNSIGIVPSNEIADGVANDKPEDLFVQGVSHTVGDVSGLSLDGPEYVSSGPNDVAVALLVGEKDNGSSLLSSTSVDVVASP
ncbi:hypothetical protein Tco_0552771 [Tanacetum coccineum]